MPASTDWAWAAGLFEGEGSIVYHQSGGIRLKLGMTDRDVVERFAALVGVGSIYTREEMRKAHWKACTYWQVDNIDQCKAIMDRLLPFLGERRTARWHEVLALREALRPERTCPQCDETFKPIRRNQVCCCHECSWRYSKRVGRHTDRKRPPSGIRRPRKLDHDTVVGRVAARVSRKEIGRCFGVTAAATYHHVPASVGH